MLLWVMFRGKRTNRSPESHDALRDLRDVSSLPQVDGLKDVRLWDSEPFGRILEGIDVLHELEVSATRVDFGNGSWHQLINQPVCVRVTHKGFIVW